MNVKGKGSESEASGRLNFRFVAACVQESCQGCLTPDGTVSISARIELLATVHLNQMLDV
jgi:hypothetical protein